MTVPRSNSPAERAPRFPLALFVSAWLAGLVVTASADAPDAESDSFDARIAPILARHCLDCHSGADAKGKLDLSSRAGAMKGGETDLAIVPGRADESLLWERVAADEMPPKSRLSDAEKAALRGWIESGAAWGADPIDPYQVTTARLAGRDWWSLQPLSAAAVPEPTAWGRSPIDAFVERSRTAAGLGPSPEADRRTLIRRLSYDLTGLPPAPDEVEEFVNDPSPLAYENLVDRYLASSRYGVRWARWWLDLARYGESDGYEYDEYRPNAWRYRDWVVDALNRDLPYDEFSRMQLAGDVLHPEDAAAVEATGFLVAGAYDAAGQAQVSQVMKAVVRADQLEDIVSTVGQTFLGLTIHCARCHDHKFDPIRQTEYYQVASALDGVNPGDRDLTPIAAEAVPARRRLAEAVARLAAIEGPARANLLDRAGRSPAENPAPIAAWDFDHGPDDLLGSLKITLQEGATLTDAGLVLDGKTGHATTPPLPMPLAARTLDVWVKLDNLSQRGGAAISLWGKNAAVFDAIVFGEQEPARWMAGSEGFRRTRDAHGDEETEASDRPIHITITYDDNGAIRIYRDGRPYGDAYQAPGPEPIAAGEGRIVFGLRHPPVGGNRQLAGTLVRARVYDRALSASEVAASHAASGAVVSASAIAAALPPEQQAERERLLGMIAAQREALASGAHRAYVVAAREVGPMRVQLRGNPQQPGAVVSAGGIAALRAPGADFQLPPDAPEGARRERLAAWITSPENPLFARVIVNRLWQEHFGAGLVETPNDLGFNGGAPSHPELLDWLAAELVRQRWSLKAMHRAIVTTSAYRQASRSNAVGLERDAGNRWLWRKSPTRLEAEMVRDAMLSAAGLLDERDGGPSFRDLEPIKAPGTPAILYRAADPAAPGLSRRTLYRAWSRGGRNPFLDVFDCPDPSTVTPRRAVTTTPLQALSLLNNALVLHLCDALADRLRREAGSDPSRQVDRAYRLVFLRDPDAAERAAAVRVVERHGPAALARAMFNSNEFLYVD